MRQPRRYSTESLVIRHLDYGEADRILTLYTPDYGKIHAIAKGVRRPRSRRSGHLELFSRSTMMLAHGRNLDIITQVESLEHFHAIRSDVLIGAQAHYVSELIDAFVPDRLPNSQLYRMHLEMLRSLDMGGGSMRLRAFEVALLDECGYRPELHRCLGCGQEITPQVNRFSSALGGVLCPACSGEDLAAKDISVPALKLLRNLQTNPGRILRLESVDGRLALEVEHRLEEYISYRLERRPKSIAVLNTLEAQLSRVPHA